MEGLKQEDYTVVTKSWIMTAFLFIIEILLVALIFVGYLLNIFLWLDFSWPYRHLKSNLPIFHINFSGKITDYPNVFCYQSFYPRHAFKINDRVIGQSSLVYYLMALFSNFWTIKSVYQLCYKSKNSPLIETTTNFDSWENWAEWKMKLLLKEVDDGSMSLQECKYLSPFIPKFNFFYEAVNSITIKNTFQNRGIDRSKAIEYANLNLNVQGLQEPIDEKNPLLTNEIKPKSTKKVQFKEELLFFDSNQKTTYPLNSNNHQSKPITTAA